MIITLTPLAVVLLLGWVCRVLARRAWQQMPVEQTTTAYSRSQRRNRAGAVVYYEGRPYVRRVQFARHRTDSRTRNN